MGFGENLSDYMLELFKTALSPNLCFFKVIADENRGPSEDGLKVTLPAKAFLLPQFRPPDAALLILVLLLTNLQLQLCKVPLT